ncbi:cupin domain-containing protein [Halioxenophilus aromaticivorans]|uniref:Cupin domain-containing protein n=1 Tax=Halioxenophilus aromaticivorans TaxID=1306992 RepID=A0AAV3U7U2_9ALTE
MIDFFKADQHPYEDIGGGLSRKLVGHTNELMVVYVQFAKDAIGEVHHHEDHDQIAYVLKGSFKVQLAETMEYLKTGDAFVAPKRVSHGVVSLEEGSVLLDIFSPRRMDFLINPQASQKHAKR